MDNPLIDLFVTLAQSLQMDFKESQARVKKKVKLNDEQIIDPSFDQTLPPISTLVQSDQPRSVIFTPPLDRPSAPIDTSPHPPSSFQTPSNKRTVSGTSFGTLSTETTPTRWTQPEIMVQQFQNQFITRIINTIWRGSIRMPWITGRKMVLQYRPYLPTQRRAYCRTSKTSFEFKLSKDGESRTGRVTAIADGALVLITDKAKDPNSTCIWSKQRSAIAFEVRP